MIEIKRKNNIFYDQEIPFFEAIDLETNKKEIVVSGIFLEKYLNKECFDTINRIERNSSVYEKNVDYFLNSDFSSYDELGIKIKDTILRSYDAMFTEEGFNKYFSRFSKINKETYSEEINNLIYYFGIYKSKESITPLITEDDDLENDEVIEEVLDVEIVDNNNLKNNALSFFDILNEETYDLDEVIAIINDFVVDDFGYTELCKIINGKFKIKGKFNSTKINNTVVPDIVRYVEKDALVYILSSLFSYYDIDKSTLIKIVKNIVVSFYV